MKIFVIHGDNEVRARLRLKELLIEAQKKGLSIQKITSNEELFGGKLSSSGLFGENIILIENPASFSKKDLGIVLKSKKAIGNIIFFHRGYLAKGFLDIVPDEAEIEEFKLPKTIYKFLDSFYPGNSRNALFLLHSLSKNDPEGLVLHLLARQLRDLYLIKENPKSLSYPEWRILKLAHVSEKFTKEKLANLIKELAKIDIAIKTSKEDLISSLDLLIVTELE